MRFTSTEEIMLELYLVITDFGYLNYIHLQNDPISLFDFCHCLTAYNHLEILMKYNTRKRYWHVYFQ